MHLVKRSAAALAAGALAFVFVSAPAAPAEAQKKSKAIQTEAKWIKFDASNDTVTVKVEKPGRGNKDRELRRGKEAVFNVKPEGTVLTRTSVKVNGKRGELTDIPEGKTVNIYWVPDEDAKGERFARTIDVTLSDEELEERYGYED